MGRRERSLTGTGPVVDIAEALRQLRYRSGMTYRELSQRSGVSLSALSSAASGSSLPSWNIVRAYVQACDEDPEPWRAKWEEAAGATTVRPGANPDQVGDGADAAAFSSEDEAVLALRSLTRQLQYLRVKAGQPTLRSLSARAGVGPSRIHMLLTGAGDRVPRHASVLAYLDAVDASPVDRDKVEALWRSAVAAATARRSSRPTALRPALRQLPAGLSSFVGRLPELDLIAQTVTRRRPGTVPVVAIDGMAGIGKSALAIHAAHRLAEQFPDGQLYVSFHSHDPGRTPASAAGALAELLVTLGVTSQSLPPVEDARAAILRDRLAGSRTLLVLDDAVSAAQVMPFIPGTEGCAVLITSRRCLMLPGAEPLHLGTLAEDDAVTLLGHIAGVQLAGNESQLTEIVRYCGRLPLAVAVVGAHMSSRTSWSMDDFIAFLRESADRADGLGRLGQAVHTALDESYRSLTEHQRDLLYRISLHPDREISESAIVASSDLPVDVVRRVLDELVERNLLEEAARGRYSLHELVKEYVADRAERDAFTA